MIFEKVYNKKKALIVSVFIVIIIETSFYPPGSEITKCSRFKRYKKSRLLFITSIVYDCQGKVF